MLQRSLLLLLFLTSLHAQDARGQILGRVTDQSGATVAGARVTATNTATNVASSAATSSTGDYTIEFLIPATYTVLVEMPGFEKALQDHVIVEVSETVTVNVKLTVGNTTDTIKVTAESPMLDTADASLGLVIDSKMLEELPVKDANPFMLAMLAPGVSNLQTNGALSLPFDNANASLISVSGSRSGTNEYNIDGAPNTAGQSGNFAYSPPAGAVSEFKIQTNTFDARNGFAMGGNVNVTLKSGGNDLHGESYVQIENPVLNANSFFSNAANLGKDNYREFRAAIVGTGPVIIPRVYNGRNRTFWMYAYEKINANVPHHASNLVYSVPTPAERTGDFSALLKIASSYQIYDPLTTKPSTTAGRYQRSPFPGNIIPASRLDPVALNIMQKYYPQPNVPGTADGTNNYTIPSIELNWFWNQLFRIDHQFSERHHTFLRGTANSRFQDVEERFNGSTGNTEQRDNRGIGIDDVYVISPSFLFNWRYNYTRYQVLSAPYTLGFNPATLGFSQNLVNEIDSINPKLTMLPTINISSYGEINNAAYTPNFNDIHAAAFDFTRIWRNHTMHFGGEWRVYRDTYANRGQVAGLEDFSTTYTKGPLDNSSSSPNSIGQSLASFILGIPTGGSIDVNDSYAEQYQVAGWYFQDTWKFNSRLTVNAGLRWEMELPTTERYNRSVRGFDPTAALPIAAAVQSAYAQHPSPLLAPSAFAVQGGVTFAGVNGQPRSLWTANRHNLAPRIALAYALNGRTVVRAGYGIFYDLARQLDLLTGFNRSTTLTPSNDTGQTYIASLANPFPSGILFPQAHRSAR